MAFPRVMFFHLNRYSGRTGEKLTRKVEVDQTMDLKDLFIGVKDNENLLYGMKQAIDLHYLSPSVFKLPCLLYFTFRLDLRCYIVHDGTVKGGHYTNYSNVLEDGKHIWYECNDLRVEQVADKVMTTKLKKCDGYIFMYIRREVP